MALDPKTDVRSESENSARSNPSDSSFDDVCPAVQVSEVITDSSYESALAYLYGRLNYERVGHAPYTTQHYRLDRMRWLLELLGNPQEKYAILHVAGTKGKGSVSHILANCLQSCGYRTGLYTSPHLVLLEERIRFQGRIASPEELIHLTGCVRLATEQLDRDGGGRATFFEITTAMGLLHFAHQAADCVVLEVGLGGRLDSTNVCSPIISIITSISLDHQKQLGSTLAEIASEKAGIIKPKTPVVATSHDPIVRQVLQDKAASCDAKLSLIDRDFQATWNLLDPAGIACRNAQLPVSPVAEVVFSPHAERSSNLGSSTWPTRMLGRHQADNIAAALATLDQMASLGWQLPAEKLRAAIATTQPQARLQIMSTGPTVIIDTAHNPASILAGLNALHEHFAKVPMVALFASSRDKDFRQMLELLLPRCRALVVTAYQNNPRALACQELAMAATEILRRDNFACQIYPADSPAQGLQLANALALPSEILYATGSFFLAAELLELLPQECGDAA